MTKKTKSHHSFIYLIFSSYIKFFIYLLNISIVSIAHADYFLFLNSSNKIGLELLPKKDTHIRLILHHPNTQHICKLIGNGKIVKVNKVIPLDSTTDFIISDDGSTFQFKSPKDPEIKIQQIVVTTTNSNSSKTLAASFQCEVKGEKEIVVHNEISKAPTLDGAATSGEGDPGSNKSKTMVSTEPSLVSKLSLENTDAFSILVRFIDLTPDSPLKDLLAMQQELEVLVKCKEVSAYVRDGLNWLKTQIDGYILYKNKFPLSDTALSPDTKQSSKVLGIFSKSKKAKTSDSDIIKTAKENLKTVEDTLTKETLEAGDYYIVERLLNETKELIKSLKKPDPKLEASLIELQGKYTYKEIRKKRFLLVQDQLVHATLVVLAAQSRFDSWDKAIDQKEAAQELRSAAVFGAGNPQLLQWVSSLENVLGIIKK